MSRLIDADVLTEEIKSLQVFVTGLRAGKGDLNEYAKQYRESVLRIINEQPTAYDVEKIVAELEQTLGNTNFEKATSEVNESYYDGLSYAYGDAIDIIKKGGVE